LGREITLFFLSLTFPFLSWAKPLSGTSEIAFCHKDNSYSSFIRQFEKQKRIVTGWLDNSFNKKGCPNAEKLMKAKRPVVIRVHILNGPGLANKRLEKHEIHYGLSKSRLDSKIRNKNQAFLSKYRKRLYKLKSILDLRTKGALTVFVSPCLECRLSKQARKVLVDETLQVLPFVYPVDNPLTESCIKGVICERHGDKASTISDMDGLSFFDANLAKWKKATKNSLMRLVWLPCHNGLGGTGPWVPPTKRTRWCSPTERDLVRAYLEDL